MVSIKGCGRSIPLAEVFLFKSEGKSKMQEYRCAHWENPWIDTEHKHLCSFDGKTGNLCQQCAVKFGVRW